MSYAKRIKRLEKKTPQQHGETLGELLDRLGMGCMKQDIQAAGSFRDVVVDQEKKVVWRR